MSDFQKLTLKGYGRNFLIVCGFILLVYGMIKSTLVLYAAVAILALTIAGACAWSMISSIRWDWRLRGKLTEDEYKAYQACDKTFGLWDDKYLPNEAQIRAMIVRGRINEYIAWKMFYKLKEEETN